MRLPLSVEHTMDGHLRALRDIKQALLGRLTFGENIQGSVVTVVTPGAANTDFTVNHGLERIPVSFFFHSDIATNIYKGSVAWTSKTVTLRSSAATATITLTIV